MKDLLRLIHMKNPSVTLGDEYLLNVSQTLNHLSAVLTISPLVQH